MVVSGALEGSVTARSLSSIVATLIAELSEYSTVIVCVAAPAVVMLETVAVALGALPSMLTAKLPIAPAGTNSAATSET